MKQLLINEFKDFFQEIQLGSVQSERIESATEALSDYLIKQYELDSSDIFVQGSISTQTIIKPAPSLKDEGEYDVDLVVLCVKEDDGPSDALEKLEDVLRSNGTYKDKLEKDDPKIPCVRLRYADEDSAKFHVDLVPAKSGSVGNNILVPRRNEGWETSNPSDYTKWILEKGEKYQRTVMMLKRWRDEQKAPIKSIVLQILVANCFTEKEEDSANLSSTLKALNEYLEDIQTPPKLPNPVLPEEILTKRWNTADFLSFKKLISEASTIAQNAIDEEDHDEAATLWQKLLGESFIFESDKKVSLGQSEDNLGDTSHAKPLTYPFNPTDGVSVRIKGVFTKNWTRKLFKLGGNLTLTIPGRKNIINPGDIVESGGGLDFSAVVIGLPNRNQYEIHWQVVNTGVEAKRVDGLRGNFFTSSEFQYRHESTEYEGTHWIECFIIMNGSCVARSGRFYVNIVHAYN